MPTSTELAQQEFSDILLTVRELRRRNVPGAVAPSSPDVQNDVDGDLEKVAWSGDESNCQMNQTISETVNNSIATIIRLRADLKLRLTGQ